MPLLTLNTVLSVVVFCFAKKRIYVEQRRCKKKSLTHKMDDRCFFFGCNRSVNVGEPFHSETPFDINLFSRVLCKHVYKTRRSLSNHCTTTNSGRLLIFFVARLHLPHHCVPSATYLLSFFIISILYVSVGSHIDQVNSAWLLCKFYFLKFYFMFIYLFYHRFYPLLEQTQKSTKYHINRLSEWVVFLCDTR